MVEPVNLPKVFPNAAGKLATMPKVTPEVMMIVYLDEIAGRLADLQEALAEMTAEGTLKGKSYAVTEEPTPIYTNSRYLSIHNSGDSAVYLLQDKNKPASNDASVAKNGELNLDFGTKRMRAFYLVCAASGTATVKVWAW